MTAQTTAPPRARRGLFRAIGRGLRAAARKVTSTVRRITTRLRRSEAEPQSATEGAVTQGVVAAAEGRNPVWGAIKGAWQGMSVGWKVAVVVIALLLVVLAPVVAVLLLLALLILAIVSAVRGRSGSPQPA